MENHPGSDNDVCTYTGHIHQIIMKKSYFNIIIKKNRTLYYSSSSIGRFWYQ